MTASAPETTPATTPEDRHHWIHGWAEYPSFCPQCRAQQEQDAADREAEYHGEIDQLTCTLANASADAEKAIGQAQQAITRLLSNQVYDEELMGANGSDVTAELETAARAIRNVKRIAAWRREILLAADPMMTGIAP